MRLLHTSDWHLGHTLHELPRRREHAAFLSWLLEQLGTERIDALLIAGDIFETANPPADAQADFYEFLAHARQRYPKVGIVIIGGNHDSAGRLDAPEPLLRALDVHVVGGLPRKADRTIDLDRCLVPLKDAEGRPGALVCAVPFLRSADLPALEPASGKDPLVEGVRQVYGDVLAAARERRSPGEALIGMGHLYMASTQLSELSERKILGGNQHALPKDIFPGDLAYVALGHLHLAQKVCGDESVRYSGSPIPLSFHEAAYKHQVLVVELEGEKLASVKPLEIPRAVPLLRLPSGAAGTLTETLLELKKLPALEEGQRYDDLPYLEVRVRLDGPEPGLRRELEKALEGKAARLTKITTELTGTGKSLAEAAGRKSLGDVSPEEVFRLKYQRDHQGEPSQELLAAFHELIEAEGREEAA